MRSDEKRSKLIGYFYIDCPTWIHTRPHNEWKGPLFDPERLKSEIGRRELYSLATAYYKTTYEAIRRYDKDHLILGDRYEAGRPLAEEVIEAALPYVDVLSFQHLRRGQGRLEHAGGPRKPEKPVLLADHAIVVNEEDGSARHDGQGYSQMLETLLAHPGCSAITSAVHTSATKLENEHYGIQ